MNEIRQESKEVRREQFRPEENGVSYVQDIGYTADKQQRRKGQESPFTGRIIRGAGVAFAAAILALILFATGHGGRSVDKSIYVEDAIETHVSTTLGVGTRILKRDDNYIGGDMTIMHSSDKEETTLYVWDYAAEDGDYVQVFVDGAPLGEPFMIRSTPVSFTIPSVCEVKVVGTHDGGGGITYAVYYEVDQTTYFNGTSQGGDNTYTLVRE